MRVLGNVGALVHTKRAKPGQLICVCGCMAQEPHMAQKIKDSYRQVDLVFGPPRPVAVPGAALPPCDPPGAHLRHRRRARLHRRGHPPWCARRG